LSSSLLRFKNCPAQMGACSRTGEPKPIISPFVAMIFAATPSIGLVLRGEADLIAARNLEPLAFFRPI